MQNGSLDRRVQIAAVEAGIRPGSPMAAEILVPRTRWERVRRKMDRLRRKWGLCLPGGKGAPPPSTIAKKEKKWPTGLEGLEDIAESEDEDEDADMGDVLPSIEVEK